MEKLKNYSVIKVFDDTNSLHSFLKNKGKNIKFVYDKTLDTNNATCGDFDNFYESRDMLIKHIKTSIDFNKLFVKALVLRETQRTIYLAVLVRKDSNFIGGDICEEMYFFHNFWKNGNKQ